MTNKKKTSLIQTVKKEYQIFSKAMDKIASQTSLQNKFPNYHFNKNVFRGAILILIITAGYIIYIEDTESLFEQHGYATCPPTAQGGFCHNPYFREDCPEIGSKCSLRYIPTGMVVGREPSLIYQYYDLLAWAIIILAFLTNHTLHTYKKGLK